METWIGMVLLCIGFVAGWIVRHRIEIDRLKTLESMGMLDQALEAKPVDIFSKEGDVKDGKNDKGTE